MKKMLLSLSLIMIFVLSGCDVDTFDDITYPYPDSKNVIVTLAEFNQLENGMSPTEVWDIIGGECTLSSELGEKGTAYYTVGYGCNGSGKTGANVILMFQGNKLSSKTQVGLK